MKLVLDTNVLVSALGWPGPPAEVLRGCIRGEFQLSISPELLAELSRVLSYPKLAPLAACPELADLLSFLHRLEHLVLPTQTVSAVPDDPADNRVLEAAVAARADCIVSGDQHLLQLRIRNDIPILTPTEFLRRHKR